MVKFTTVDEYISSFPQETQRMLSEMRETIRKAAPKATEVISYNMPGFRQHGVLVYYGGHTQHIGFYPTSAPMVAFKDELGRYKTSRGAIQFPLGEPIPKTLVKRIVKFRIEQDQQRAASAGAGKRTSQAAAAKGPTKSPSSKSSTRSTKSSKTTMRALR